MVSASMPVLAATRVRYVGEPLALVVAETVAQALDAAEAVTVEYRQLPAVSDVTRAMAAGRAANLARGTRQHRPRLGRRRRRRRRCSLCTAPRTSSACDCSTRGWRRVPWSRALRSPRYDPADRALHPYRAHARRGGGAQDFDRGCLQGSDRQDPGPHPRCRRRLWHEGADLRRVCRPALCRAPHRTTGEMDRHPAGELSRRHARPRRRARRRTRTRRRRPLPRLAGAHLRRHRRLHDDLCRDHHDMEHQELPVERLCLPGHLLQHESGADQRRADGPLSRRRPPRSDLSDRAPDRRRSARDEHRSRGVAPAEHDRAGRHALQDAQRADLRQRRLRCPSRQGAGGG